MRRIRLPQDGAKLESRHLLQEADCAWSELIPDAHLFAQPLPDNTNCIRLQLLSSVLTGKQPVLGLPSSPVDTQDLQQLQRQHDLARELALALADVDDHPLAVDVGDLQIQRFLTAQACAVVYGQQCAMLDVHLFIEQCTNFLPASDGGQLALHLGLDDFLIKPGLP
jgi:hypothetical protein